MLESWPSVSCWQWRAPLWQLTESFPTPAVSLGNCRGEEREERGGEGREEREGREGRKGGRNMIDGARGMGCRLVTVQHHLSLDFCSRNSCVSSSRMVCRHFLQYNAT